MAPFTYNDTVRVKQAAPAQWRPGELASVVGISLEAERSGEFLKTFPHGILYTIEFEDGSSVQLHEDLVRRAHSQANRVEKKAREFSRRIGARIDLLTSSPARARPLSRYTSLTHAATRSANGFRVQPLSRLPRNDGRIE